VDSTVVDRGHGGEVVTDGLTAELTRLEVRMRERTSEMSLLGMMISYNQANWAGLVRWARRRRQRVAA
jgi:hypothetical protein